MIFCMFRNIIEQFKIFYGIVLSVFNTFYRKVNPFVMGLLFRHKIPSKMFLHHKTGSFNISIGTSKGMFWFKDKNVPFSVFCYSALPSWTFFSRSFRKFFAFTPRNLSNMRYAKFFFCFFSVFFPKKRISFSRKSFSHFFLPFFCMFKSIRIFTFIRTKFPMISFKFKEFFSAIFTNMNDFRIFLEETFSRTIFSPVFFNSIKRRFKLFFTNYTSFFNHNNFYPFYSNYISNKSSCKGKLYDG